MLQLPYVNIMQPVTDHKIKAKNLYSIRNTLARYLAVSRVYSIKLYGTVKYVLVISPLISISNGTISFKLQPHNHKLQAENFCGIRPRTVCTSQSGPLSLNENLFNVLCQQTFKKLLSNEPENVSNRSKLTFYW